MGLLRPLGVPAWDCCISCRPPGGPSGIDKDHYMPEKGRLIMVDNHDNLKPPKGHSSWLGLEWPAQILNQPLMPFMCAVGLLLVFVLVAGYRDGTSAQYSVVVRKVLTAAASSTADALARRSCPCPKYYAPVCGSDGQTYDNECIADCAGVTATSQDPMQGCGQTVGQQQALLAAPNKQQDTLAGSLQDQSQAMPNQPVWQAPTACTCPNILAPVCGTDGKLYTNACLVKCAGVGVGQAPGPSNVC